MWSFRDDICDLWYRRDPGFYCNNFIDTINFHLDEMTQEMLINAKTIDIKQSHANVKKYILFLRVYLRKISEIK